MRALERVGYVIVKMPDFDMEHLNACRDGKKGTQYNWLPILNQVNRASNKFYNARDLKKRFQKHVILSEEYIVQQYEKWRERYKLGQLQLYKVALLRSLPGCGRQYYHCDTHSVNTLKDEQFDDYHLGAVYDAVDDSGAAHDEDEQNAGIDQHESGAEDTDLYQDVDYDRLQHEERFAISMNKAKHLRSISIDEDETVGTSSQFEYWLHRGEKLQHMSLYDYTAIILVRKMLDKEKPQSCGNVASSTRNNGRKKNPVFYFTNSLKQHKVLIQQQRSKFVVPLRIGRHRPPYPIKQPSETFKAFANRRLEFAHYFAAILLPCGSVGVTNKNDFIETQWEYGHTWEGWCTIVEGWKNDYEAHMNHQLHEEADCPTAAPCLKCLTCHKIHNIGRWHIYNNMTRGMCTNVIQRTIQLKYRSRATVAWKDMDPDDVPVRLRKRASNDDMESAELKARHAADMLQSSMDPKNQKKYRKEFLYHERLNRCTDFLNEINTPPFPSSNYTRRRIPNYKRRYSIDATEVMLDRLLTSSSGNIAFPQQNHDANTCSFVTPVEQPPPELDKFPDQREVFKYALTALSKRDGEQLLLLICGGPGTGKTYLQRLITDRVLARLGMGVKGCSLQGSAAVLMKIGTTHGETMHTSFSINVYNNKKKKKNYLKALFPLLEHVDLIVMDEISMTSAEQFASIDSNMQEALQLYREINGKDKLP
eukprot:g2372.t1